MLCSLVWLDFAVVVIVVVWIKVKSNVSFGIYISSLLAFLLLVQCRTSRISRITHPISHLTQVEVIFRPSFRGGKAGDARRMHEARFSVMIHPGRRRKLRVLRLMRRRDDTPGTSSSWNV